MYICFTISCKAVSIYGHNNELFSTSQLRFVFQRSIICKIVDATFMQKGPLKTYYVLLCTWLQRVKDMLAILEKFRSAYLGPFMSLSEHIGQEAVVAEQNLKHLITIEDLCKRLSTSKIRDIPPLLPKLLLRIRMIWKLSPYYNTSDKITGLLCKVLYSTSLIFL